MNYHILWKKAERIIPGGNGLLSKKHTVDLSHNKILFKKLFNSY